MRRFAAVLTLALLCALSLRATYTSNPVVYQATATVTATGASTSAQSLIGTGAGSTTIPANFFYAAGVGLVLEAGGYYSSGTITTQTLTITFKLGSTTILASSAFTPITSVTNGVWQVRCVIQALTVGSSGTVQPNCSFNATGSALTPGDAAMVNTSAVTLNTTVTQAATFTATWGGSPSSSQTITSTQFSLTEGYTPLVATGGGATFTFVAATKSPSDCTSLPCTVSYSPTAGHFVKVDFYGKASSGDAGTLAGYDNIGNTYATAVSDNAVFGTQQLLGEFYICSESAGVTTIGVNGSGWAGISALVVIVSDYSYSGGTCAIDQTSSLASGSGTSVAAGSVTTTQPNELVTGFIAQSNQTQIITPTSPYVDRDDVATGAGFTLSSLDHIVSSTGTYALAGMVASSAAYAGYTVSYK